MSINLKNFTKATDLLKDLVDNGSKVEDAINSILKNASNKEINYLGKSLISNGNKNAFSTIDGETVLNLSEIFKIHENDYTSLMHSDLLDSIHISNENVSNKKIESNIRKHNERLNSYPGKSWIDVKRSSIKGDTDLYHSDRINTLSKIEELKESAKENPEIAKKLRRYELKEELNELHNTDPVLSKDSLDTALNSPKGEILEDSSAFNKKDLTKAGINLEEDSKISDQQWKEQQLARLKEIEETKIKNEKEVEELKIKKEKEIIAKKEREKIEQEQVRQDKINKAKENLSNKKTKAQEVFDNSSQALQDFKNTHGSSKLEIIEKYGETQQAFDIQAELTNLTKINNQDKETLNIVNNKMDNIDIGESIRNNDNKKSYFEQVKQDFKDEVIDRETYKDMMVNHEKYSNNYKSKRTKDQNKPRKIYGKEAANKGEEALRLGIGEIKEDELFSISKVSSIAMSGISAIQTYKEKRREGKNAISSAVTAGADFALSEMVGPLTYTGLQLLKAVPNMAVSGIQSLQTENRKMNSAAKLGTFGDAQFHDTQQLATMRQSGMELAKMANYRLEQTLMGNEARYMHR